MEQNEQNNFGARKPKLHEYVGKFISSSVGGEAFVIGISRFENSLRVVRLNNGQNGGSTLVNMTIENIHPISIKLDGAITNAWSDPPRLGHIIAMMYRFSGAETPRIRTVANQMAAAPYMANAEASIESLHDRIKRREEECKEWERRVAVSEKARAALLADHLNKDVDAAPTPIPAPGLQCQFIGMDNAPNGACISLKIGGKMVDIDVNVTDD